MLGQIFSENKLTCCELAVGCVPVLTPLLLISQVDVAAVPPRRVHSFDMDVQGVQLVESVKQIYGTYTIYFTDCPLQGGFCQFDHSFLGHFGYKQRKICQAEQWALFGMVKAKMCVKRQAGWIYNKLHDESHPSVRFEHHPANRNPNHFFQCFRSIFGR